MSCLKSCKPGAHAEGCGRERNQRIARAAVAALRKAEEHKDHEIETLRATLAERERELEALRSKAIDTVCKVAEDIPANPALNWFAKVMDEKLSLNDHKPGWRNESLGWLFKRLHGELAEAHEACGIVTAHLAAGSSREDTEQAINEAINEMADVANYCMMVADSLRVRVPPREG